MIEFLQTFHFIRPWILLFLLLPLGLYAKKMKFSVTSSSWENICDAHLLKFLLVNDNNSKKINIKKFIYVGLIFTTLAAAGPSWKKEDIPTFVIENPNMFVISLAQDMQLTDVAPSRLDRAKFMLSDIADGLLDGQFGLEVYSHEPYIISPFTDDAKLIKSLLPQIVPNIVPDQGDRLDRAINMALERFQSAGYTSGNIILFASDVGQRYDLALEKVNKAVANNYNVHVIDTSYSGNEKLKILAETGKGIYLNVQETSPQNLLHRINTLNQEKTTLSNNTRSNFIDYGYYLIIIPLLCVLVFFRRGLLLLIMCCFSTQAYADFWRNDNQVGLSLFKNGKYDEALEKFTDVNWRGISFYKQERFEDALKEFAKSNDSETLYNKGVVLVKLCKYQDALDVFDLVLKNNPQHTDALYNKQVLIDLFEKSKTDPKVLECDNQQQDNNQKQPQDNKQDSEKNNNSSENSEPQASTKEDTSPDNDSQQTQNDSEQSDDSPKSNDDSSNKDNMQKKADSQQESSDNNDKNTESQQDSNDESMDSHDNQSPANNDNGSENRSNNKEGDDENGQEEQLGEQQAQPVNIKKGDDNEKYDEEALAIQRRYREIPEDVGGLLREFIKKEYMKDRYKNEDM